MPYGHTKPHWTSPRRGSSNSVMVPSTPILPILLPASSVNQRFPSGPRAIDCGSALGVGSAYSETCPAVVILPISFAPGAVNHNAPSLPAAIEVGAAFDSGNGYSVTAPACEIRPIPDTPLSVNHMAPSGPSTIAEGNESRDGVVNVVNVGGPAGLGAPGCRMYTNVATTRTVMTPVAT